MGFQDGTGKSRETPLGYVLESKSRFARSLLLCSTAISEALNGIHH